jgi:hypothetical protein
MKRGVLYKIPSLCLEKVLEKKKQKEKNIKYHNVSHGNQLGENFPTR